MTAPRINKIFQKATRKALVGWETDLDSTELINELWVWYLESPYIQKMLDGQSEGEAVKYSRRQAINLLSKQAKGKDLFSNRGKYSSESVKDALKGVSTNRYLLSILPVAMEALDKQNPGYAEALRVRYDDGVIPTDKPEQNRLVRAHKSLSEHVNIIALTAGGGGKEGPQLRLKGGLVDPDSVSGSGGHSDPTADIALMLIEHPELRDDYLYESPVTQWTGPRQR